MIPQNIDINNILNQKKFNYWQRGGMVTQRIANPCIPVRFRALPPIKLVQVKKISREFVFLRSSFGKTVVC